MLKNTVKLAHSKVEIQNVYTGVTPPDPCFRGRERAGNGQVGGEVIGKDPLFCLQINPWIPNLNHKLDNAGSTQTHTILSLSPIRDDIVNHVTATYVTYLFPFMSDCHLNQMTSHPPIMHFLHVLQQTHSQCWWVLILWRVINAITFTFTYILALRRFSRKWDKLYNGLRQCMQSSDWWKWNIIPVE